MKIKSIYFLWDHKSGFFFRRIYIYIYIERERERESFKIIQLVVFWSPKKLRFFLKNQLGFSFMHIYMIQRPWKISFLVYLSRLLNFLRKNFLCVLSPMN